MVALVPHKEKPRLMEELKEVFPREQEGKSIVVQFELFCNFVDRWSKRYPSFKLFKHERNIAHFAYLAYPAKVQRMLYTTNWIERLNREYKRALNMRGAMPSGEAVIFLLGQVALQKSQTTYSKKVPHIEAWTLMENRESAH